MNRPHIPTLHFAALATLVTPALAVINIDYVAVTVGNAGNAADTATSDLYGEVPYEFQIAKNETAISQYAEFLNAVAKTYTHSLCSTSMTTTHIDGITQSCISGSSIYAVNPGSRNKPLTFVGRFDAARFCNWMHNGQPVGVQDALSTENGAYGLPGAMSGVGFTLQASAKFWIYQNPGAKLSTLKETLFLPIQKPQPQTIKR